MNKKLYAFAILLLMSSAGAMAAQWNIQATSSFTYSPSMVDATVGDTINFSGSFSFHPTVEVTEATWNQNGTTPISGGFSFTSGSSGTVVLTAIGDRYYVCQNHVGSGMKGMIMVSGPTAVKTARLLATALSPNPATSVLTLPAGHKATEVTILNSGRLVARKALAQGQLQLPVADLPPGVYALLMDKKVYRFVKE